MRQIRKTTSVLFSATAAVFAVSATTHTANAALVTDFVPSAFATGGNWTDSTGGIVATAAGSNTLVSNIFGTNPGVDVRTGNGFSLPKLATTPPGGSTSFTMAVVFDPTAAAVSGNNYYQASTLFGYDIGGGAQPDAGISFGGSTGTSIVAGVGANEGDRQIITPALALNQTHSVVYQINAAGAGTGTATLYIDGKLAGTSTGLTFVARDPSRAGGAFGLGGQFTSTFPGYVGEVQVYNDATINAQSLSQALLTSNGGSFNPITLFNWTNSGTGLFTAGSNWDQGTAPNNVESAQARIANGGTAQIVAGNTISLLDAYIGDLNGTANGVGNVTQTGGDLTVGNSFYLGRNNASGTYNISGGTFTYKGVNLLNLGGNPTTPSVMTISGTAAVSETTGAGNFSVGEGTTSGTTITPGNAVLNVTGGTLTTANSDLWVGDHGSDTVGVVNVSGGTLSINSWLAVGRDAATGTLNISGTGVVSRPSGAGGSITVGSLSGSHGTINQTGGSIVNPSNSFFIGESGADTGAGRAAATGVYNQSGGTATVNSVDVGFDGTGIYNLSGSATLTTSSVSVATNGGGIGTWNISGGTANTTSVDIGRNGNGTLTVSGTGALNTTTLTVGTSGGGVGTVNLNGGVVTLNAFNRGSSTGTSTVNFNGGTVRAAADAPTLLAGFRSGELVSQSGGLTLDTNGHAVGLSGTLSGAGGLTKIGTGTLTINSTGAGTYTGVTTIKAGTLAPSLKVFNNNVYANDVSGYYRFNDASTLGKDSSLHANNLISVFGGATFDTKAPAGHTGSVKLSSNDYFTTDDGATQAAGNAPSYFPLGNSSYTLAAWINLDGLKTGGPVTDNGIIGYGKYGTARSVNALRTGYIQDPAVSNSINNYWWDSDMEKQVPDGVSLTNNWHYVSATYDSGTDVRTLYVDGITIGSDNPGVNNSTIDNFRIGQTNTLTANEFFSGNMADVLVTDTALSPSQLAIASSVAGIQFGTYTQQSALNPGVYSIAGGATLDLAGTNQTISALIDSGSTGGIVSNSNSTYASTLTLTPTGTNTFDGVVANGAGTTSLTVNGAGIQVLNGVNTYNGATTVTAGTLTVGATGSIASTTISVASAGTLNLNGSATGTPAVTANGVVNVGSNTGTGILARNFSSLSVGSGGLVTLVSPAVHTNRTVLTSGTLTIAGAVNAYNGKVDLGSNDLVVTSGNLATITNEAASGFNNGLWNGSGLASSAANADAKHLTALGVIANNNGSGGKLFGAGASSGLFDGTDPALNSVLVKYTYYGDANLDGRVDGSDYTKIDHGFSTPGSTGWVNGDFNYDGSIDGSDYTLIDNAFNTQGGNLSTSSASLFASATAQIAAGSAAAVPEPASLGLLTVVALTLIRRRRSSVV